jgi:hypothetical protein
MDYLKRSWKDQQEDAMVKDKTGRTAGKKAISYIGVSILSVLAACLLYSSDANAAVSKPSEKSSDIEIKIEGTRPQLTFGTSLGITAEVKNISTSVIHLHEKHITMVPPCELVGSSFPSGWFAHFPTEVHYEKDAEGKPHDYYDVTIAIQPGDSYKVLWYTPVGVETPDETPSIQKEGKSAWRKIYDTVRKIYDAVRPSIGILFNPPGDYSITIAAKYWKDPEKPTAGKYHTKVETKTFNVASPQSVILFGAMLGGLISYILFPQARRRLVASETGKEAPSRSKKFVREVFGIIGAVLLSAIVTILLARISETQFLIKVTVADFWGAVAIGFVANYAGAEVINKIIDRYSKKQATQGASTQR